MPSVELKGDLNDAFWIRALMFFPNDHELRDQYYTVLKLDFETINSPESTLFHLDAYSIRLLLSSPSYSEFKNRTIALTKQGIVAGDVLAAVYLMNLYMIPEPSMLKARYIARKFAESNVFGDGDKMNISSRPIKEAFNSFKPVSHFWAAWRLNQTYNFVPASSVWGDGFYTFLSLAKAVQVFALDHSSGKTKKSQSLLNKSETWILPDHIDKFDVVVDGTPNPFEQLLDQYDANDERDYA